MNNIKYVTSLLIFAEVVRQQSFTAAAAKLKLSKAAVSQQIKKLEEICGQQLLSRHTRGMALTAAGRRIYNRCETLWDQLETAVDELEVNKSAPSGDFSVTFPHLCEKQIIRPAIVQLCKEYPNINPILKMTDSALDLVGENLDVAIYGGELKDSGYRALPIGAASEVFFASPNYIARREKISRVPEISKQPFILAEWQEAHIKLILNEDITNYYETDLSPYIRVSNLASVTEFVKEGLGLGLIPEFAIGSAIGRGELVRVLPEYRGRKWPFYFVHRFQHEKPVHIERFYQLVKYYFAKAMA